MGRAKDIIVRVIQSKTANAFIKEWHYSGKVVNNSNLHFGSFLDGKLHGVMSFGSPLDKRKVLPLVEGTKWNEMVELNRMAFDEHLPKNSESRCIAIAIKLFRRNAPHVKWILSFADGGQCGDGTIYRASGFSLTGLQKCSIYENEDGEKFQQASISARGTLANKEALRIQYANGGEFGLVKGFLMKHNLTRITGYSIRYIYLIDKTCKITVPILPFSAIDEAGARMYKGKRPGSEIVSRPAFQQGSGGANPTSGLKETAVLDG